MHSCLSRNYESTNNKKKTSETVAAQRVDKHKHKRINTATLLLRHTFCKACGSQGHFVWCTGCYEMKEAHTLRCKACAEEELLYNECLLFHKYALLCASAQEDTSFHGA